MKRRLVALVLVGALLLAVWPGATQVYASAGRAAPTIAAGWYHSLAIQVDGSLWAWGWNGGGQLGDGTTEHRHNPVRIMENMVSVAAGHNHSLAIQTDGSLWAWGRKDVGSLWAWEWNVGALGDGTTTDRYSPVRIMENVVYVAAGGWHSLAIQADGSLWAWGWNQGGQLGDGTRTRMRMDPPFGIIDDNNRHTPVRIMATLPDSTMNPA